MLERSNGKFGFLVNWGRRPTARERALSDREIRETAGRRDELPKDIKAFYMRVNDDGRAVAAMDVLAPGIGEIIGGSQREERLEVVDQTGRARHRQA
jgi:asparaginyl-tRNA synthetase